MSLTKRPLLFATVCVLAAGVTACSSARDGSATDDRFIRDAAKGGMMEVQMGRLGVERAQSTEVRRLAQQLIDDHTRANGELEALAARKGVTLPVEAPDTMAHKLGDKSGEEFDKTFVKMAVDDHQKDIREFERQSSSGRDADVRAWAAKTLPALREHLQVAQSLSK